MSADQLDPDDDLRRRFDEREMLREAEDAAAQLERSTRSFRDVIDAAMLAGDMVELEVGAVTVTGLVVGTSDSLVQLSDGPLRRFVNLAAATTVCVRSGGGGGSRPPAGSVELSLLGCLRSVMSMPPEGSIRVVTTSGREWTGQVVGVAEDHVDVEVDDGTIRSCRLANVAYVER